MRRAGDGIAPEVAPGHGPTPPAVAMGAGELAEVEEFFCWPGGGNRVAAG